MSIQLRPTIVADLKTHFDIQQDETAQYMSAFTAAATNDETAYITAWTKRLQNPSIHCQTILLESEIVGSVAKYEMEGDAEITYAIKKEFWGKGIATKAVQQFLLVEIARPMFARVAFDNFGSQKVLEKSGFLKIGKEIGFANARGKEIEELVYKLD